MSALAVAQRHVVARPGPAGGGRRFYDATAAVWMVKVYPGDFYVTAMANDVLVTILGSCVAACIRDPATGIGGMNHFMLPEDEAGQWGNDMMSARFGNHAMEKLINELIKLGAARERLEIKVFGGGNVIDSAQAVGSKNAAFIMRYLEEEGLRCTASDLGGDFPRRIHYTPATGKVSRRILGRSDAAPILTMEREYEGTLRSSERESGDVELFGEFR